MLIFLPFDFIYRFAKFWKNKIIKNFFKQTANFLCQRTDSLFWYYWNRVTNWHFMHCLPCSFILVWLTIFLNCKLNFIEKFYEFSTSKWNKIIKNKNKWYYKNIFYLLLSSLVDGKSSSLIVRFLHFCRDLPWKSWKKSSNIFNF